jgi:hypothetical protein
MFTPRRHIETLIAAMVVSAASLPAQAAPVSMPLAATTLVAGERLMYDVKFGSLKVGSGRMEVIGIEDVRGTPALHTLFTMKGGVPFFRVNDRMESWIDTRTMSSLRFVQSTNQGSYHRDRTIELFPETRTFIEQRPNESPRPASASVESPLDDASFLYFVRSVPLVVGETYHYERYFRPERNPVTIRVVRRERVRVPAGEFDAIVIQPVIKTKGIFSESGRAEIWLSDDDRRLVLQMKADLSFGSINLYLREYRPGGVTLVADAGPTG